MIWLNFDTWIQATNNKTKVSIRMKRWYFKKYIWTPIIFVWPAVLPHNRLDSEPPERND